MQISRLQAKGRLVLDDYTSAWAVRYECSGPFYALKAALVELDILWATPFTLTAGAFSVLFSAAASHFSVPAEIGELPRPTNDRRAFASRLRIFLRDTVTLKMSANRPRDFAHLSGGVVED